MKSIRVGILMNSDFRKPFFTALALMLLLPCMGCVEKGGTMPVAVGGLLDLSAWNIDKDGQVKLNGQWEFYWDRLLTPEDFKTEANPPEISGYLNFPGFWKGHALGDRTLPGMGCATFRLRVLTGPGARELGIQLFSLPAAFRLWANGQLVASAGVVGQTAETETAGRTITLAKLANDGAPLDLVLQVSNHYYRRGGVHYPIMLAGSGSLEAAHFHTWCWSMLFTGILMIVSVYHFVLYFLRKKDTSTLYFAMHCSVLLVMYVSMDSSEWLIRLVFPGIDSRTVDFLCFCFYAMAPSFLYRFYRSLYRDEFTVFIQYFCDIRSLVTIYIVLFMPGGTVYKVLPVLGFTSLLMNCIYIVLLGLCVRRGRSNALFLLCGCVILGATSLSEIYHHLFSTSPMTFLPIGLSAFVLFQAFALAQRFSNSFAAVESLSQAMESSNIALRAEMDERNRLEREIIKVSEEERRGLSHDLHDGLCQQLAVARLRCSVLASEPNLGKDAFANLEILSSLLDASVSHAYDLSRGLWPVEHDPQGAGPSLEELARRVGESSGIDVEFSQDLPCLACGNPHLVQLNRIAQEAVNNAVKHAKPSRISITLRCDPDSRLILEVRDDGLGRSRAVRSKGGLGLRIMAHRARMIGGELSLGDGEAGGTVLVCSLSCQASTHTTKGSE